MRGLKALKGLACLSAALLVSGCFTSYVCENGETFSVRFQKATDKIVVDEGEGKITLERVPSDSGQKYRNHGITYSFTGDHLEDLVIDVNGKNPYGRCRLVK